MCRHVDCFVVSRQHHWCHQHATVVRAVSYSIIVAAVVVDLHLFCWQCENKFNDDDDVMKCVVCELYSSVVHVMNAVV